MGSIAKPGPWAPVELHIGSRSFWVVISEDGKLAETEGNARLIAAAPDLLEALKTTAGNLRSVIAAGNHRQFDEWLATVDAAIAKAEAR